MPAFVIGTLCLGCQKCVEVCSSQAIRMFAQVAIVDSAQCTECEECIAVCMHGAITFK